MDDRLVALTRWLNMELIDGGYCAVEPEPLQVVSGDASFRRYFRCAYRTVEGKAATVIGVDSPPEKEDNPRFIRIAKTFLGCGIRVPEVLASDIGSGFLMLSDFGDSLYATRLNGSNADELYKAALEVLLDIQSCSFSGIVLPDYDSHLLLNEMGLFRDWYLDNYLGLPLSEAEQAIISHAFEYLEGQALSQPVVCVHRDYHSRNLMILDDSAPGIIDFQDAVTGPVTYDLVSLLRDCYICWPEAQVKRWALEFACELRARGQLSGVNDDRFLHWFDTMGAQRHLKAIGIFARLFGRDGKPGYLRDIPRTLNYLLSEVDGIPHMVSFKRFLVDKVIPVQQEKQSETAGLLTGVAF